jgi:hypothetical protein
MMMRFLKCEEDQPMRSLITGVAALAVIVGVELPLALADGSTSPGETSVFVSKADVTLPGCNQTAIITATIKRGKRHHVLMVQAMMLVEGFIPPVTGPAVISASPTVNGISIEPSGHGGITHFSMGQQCPSNCTITGMFWLDLDAAEDAHKGMFLGQPLDITLSGEACNSGGGVITHATLVGQLLEK